MRMTEVSFNVVGMTCPGCVAAVQRAVASLAGVRHIEVDLDTQRVQVSYDDSQIGPDAIQTRIEDAGYLAEQV